jgi:hypothetical protein
VITPLPQETLARLHQAAAAGVAEPMVLRHVMERLNALEAAQQQPANHAPAATKMVATSEGAPVATDDELFDLFHQHDPLGIVLRAVYNLGRQHGAAQPQSAPLPAHSNHEGGEYTDEEWAEIKRFKQEPSASQLPATQPAPPVAPAERLAERLRSAVRLSGGSLMDDEWQTVIREVAAWAGEQSIFDKPEVWAERLEQEAYQ